jgi:hypothetical protein
MQKPEVAVLHGPQVGLKNIPCMVAVQAVLLRPGAVCALLPLPFCTPCTAEPPFQVEHTGLLVMKVPRQFEPSNNTVWLVYNCVQQEYMGTFR